MSKPLLFAANWKMQVAPHEALSFLDVFLAKHEPNAAHTVAFSRVP